MGDYYGNASRRMFTIWMHTIGMHRESGVYNKNALETTLLDWTTFERLALLNLESHYLQIWG